MFGEEPAGQFGRIILFTGRQRGGDVGGPVCRFMLDGRTGVLLDLGRIDCFAVEPHHHTQSPRIDPALDSPFELRTDLAERGRVLTLAEWVGCANSAVEWLRSRWVAELAQLGWGEWVTRSAAAELTPLAECVRAFLLNNPPTGLMAEASP